MLYGSRNTLWVIGLIIDSVHFSTEKSTHFINWACLEALLPYTCCLTCLYPPPDSVANTVHRSKHE